MGYPVPTITTASTLPDGVTLTDNHDGTAVLTGTPDPNAGGLYPITITATNGIGAPVNQSFVLTVYQAPVIAPIDTTTITTGVAMTPLPITATGYPAPKLAGLRTAPGDQADLWVHRGNDLGGRGRLHGEDHRIKQGGIDRSDLHLGRQLIGELSDLRRHRPGDRTVGRRPVIGARSATRNRSALKADSEGRTAGSSVSERPERLSPLCRRMAPCPGVPASPTPAAGGETAYSEGAPPAHEARPDENNDQQDEGDAENDQPRLVGLETHPLWRG